MEAIVKLWFDAGRIYILTDQGNTYSRPLEAFPLLLEATPEQRAKYEIGLDGDDIHWDELTRISTSAVSMLRPSLTRTTPLQISSSASPG